MTSFADPANNPAIFKVLSQNLSPDVMSRPTFGLFTKPPDEQERVILGCLEVARLAKDADGERADAQPDPVWARAAERVRLAADVARTVRMEVQPIEPLPYMRPNQEMFGLAERAIQSVPSICGIPLPPIPNRVAELEAENAHLRAMAESHVACMRDALGAADGLRNQIDNLLEEMTRYVHQNNRLTAINASFVAHVGALKAELNAMHMPSVLTPCNPHPPMLAE